MLRPHPPTPVILFTKHSRREQNPASAHTCAKKAQPGNGVAYMACHKCVACVDISPASMFPWRCVTGHDTCPKEWGGGKSAQESCSPICSPPPPPNPEAHEDFCSEFWVGRALNGRLSCLSCGHAGAVSAGRSSTQAPRSVGQSQRDAWSCFQIGARFQPCVEPQALAFGFSFDGGRVAPN